METLLMLVASLTLVLAGNPQVDKLFEDYFEWKIDTFRVSFLSWIPKELSLMKSIFSAILLHDRIWQTCWRNRWLHWRTISKTWKGLWGFSRSSRYTFATDWCPIKSAWTKICQGAKKRVSILCQRNGSWRIFLCTYQFHEWCSFFMAKLFCHQRKF